MLGKTEIIKIRGELVKRLKNYTGKPVDLSILGIDNELLEAILFRNYSSDVIKKTLQIDKEVAKKIDWSSVSFDGFYAACQDFTGMVGVKLNPQTIFGMSLYKSILNGVTFTGPFNKTYIEGADFTGSTGAVIDLSTLSHTPSPKTNFKDALVIDKSMNPDDGDTINESDTTEEIIRKIGISFHNLYGKVSADLNANPKIQCDRFTNEYIGEPYKMK